jgi:hypothetical protein
MSGRVIIGCAVVFVAAILANRLVSHTEPPPFEPRSGAVESLPVVPWIDEERDLRQFFPGADRAVTEKHPLSAQQTTLAQKLGRPLEPGENLLTFHRVLKSDQQIGAVIIRRVKGEHGAIDLVIAISENDTVNAVKIQRTREPEQILDALQKASAVSPWNDAAYDALPSEAQISAKAIVDGVRSSLILYAARNGAASKPHH